MHGFFLHANFFPTFDISLLHFLGSINEAHTILLCNIMTTPKNAERIRASVIRIRTSVVCIRKIVVRNRTTALLGTRNM